MSFSSFSFVSRSFSRFVLAFVATVVFTTSAHAQEPEDPSPAAPVSPPPLTPPSDDPTTTTAPPPIDPVTDPEPPPAPRATPSEIEQGPRPMSEGRLLTSLYNSGFQWGISPGVVFSNGKAGFAMGISFGYGIDTGPVILVPGVRLTAYFTDPSVYMGMPTFKLVLPIDRFAPFVEGGVGIGYVTDSDTIPAKTGAAVMGGGGFMIYFRRVAFGAEASYQVITSSNFKGFGIGPILALGF